MNIAIVYDRINTWGGAERVLLALHELFPRAPLYTSVYNRATAPWAKVYDVRTSFLQRIPAIRSNHEAFSWAMPFAFESLTFDEYDLVLSVSSAEAKGIITKPNTMHICYCLTPTRYLWSHYQEYFPTKLFKKAVSPVVGYMRRWDRVAAHRPDYMIGISTAVKKRIRSYYDRDCDVVFPPVNTIKKKVSPPRKRHSNYFLVVSRLVRYKKVALVIETFNTLRESWRGEHGSEPHLVIVGKGRSEAYLKRIAGPKVSFYSDLTDEELAWYYRHCEALIMPQEEDFGLVSVEAQSYGRPVLAYRAGGALDTVIEGKTGFFFAPQSVPSLKSMIQSYYKSAHTIASSDCVENAKRFSMNVFQTAICSYIEKRVKR